MKAWLVVNNFNTTEKFTQLFDWIMKSAEARNVELIKYTNADICMDFDKLKQKVDAEKPAFCIFWDKDTLLARQLELCGLRLFNNASSIEKCDNKALTYISLLENEIDMPKTIILPKVFHPVDWSSCEVMDRIINELSLPIVIKESYGSFGQQVYLVNNKNELCDKINSLGTTQIVLQEFVKSSFAKDIRINVVGGKCVASMYRYSDTGDFRANISNGGKMKSYTPTKEESEMAIKACEILNLDFGGVDILFGANNKPLLCEVNSNAHFINIFKCTDINIADHILDYILTVVTENK